LETLKPPNPFYAIFTLNPKTSTLNKSLALAPCTLHPKPKILRLLGSCV